MRTEPLPTAAELHAAEERHPGPMSELMERAGHAVAERTLQHFAGARSFTVVCGGGSNGGDGRVCAEALRAAGHDVRVVDAKEPGLLGEPDVIVDALFGTGFSGEPRPEAAKLIEEMNESDAEIVAIDVPSGVDASTGEVAGAAVNAAITVSFQAPKLGLVVSPGRNHAGWVQVADIGLDLGTTENALVPARILQMVPRRDRSSTKYSAGSVLVVGGSPGMAGAVCLAAEAAFRADAGYVIVAAPEESLPVIEARLLEAVKRPLGEVFDAAEKASALAIGSGLGRSDEARALVRRLLEETDLPAVVDADGLHGLEPVERSAPTVLTPHAGELGRLLGEASSWVEAHRLEAVRRAAERFGAVVLLKGSDTLIAAPGEGVLVSLFGEPSLATAGTGDVLTGIVGAFLAKGMEARAAAAAAAAAHGLASKLVQNQAGLVASDLLPAIQRALAGEASLWPALA